MSRNIIVIGGVALGPKAASRLKRLDPTANVTMIDENINISFGGCGIPYYVSGEINSLDALRSTTYGTVRTPEYFEHKGVHTLNQTRVTAIDRASKTVTAKNLVTGEEKALPYDRLIIATGSTPKVPPVEGRDLKNVGGANNLEDADALRKACASGSVQNAVVIGARVHRHGNRRGPRRHVGHQDQRGGIHAAGHARRHVRQPVRYGQA